MRFELNFALHCELISSISKSFRSFQTRCEGLCGRKLLGMPIPMFHVVHEVTIDSRFMLDKLVAMAAAAASWLSLPNPMQCCTREG